MGREIYILANSPGELSGWVAPVVEEIRSIMPDAGITIALIPDWFTSGREQQFAAKLPVDKVVGVFTLIRDIWRSRSEFAAKPSLVLFMGGDALYAKGLSRLLKCPAMAYMPRVYHPADFVRIFVPSSAEKERAVRKGAEPDRITVVPTLALDSVEPSGTREQNMERFQLEESSHPVIAILGGSRPGGVDLFFAFLLDVAGHLTAEYPQAKILLPVSPFIDKSVIEGVLQTRKMIWTENAEQGVLTIAPEHRIGFVFNNTHDALTVADIAVVLPGTNNLQCASLGLPFLVIIPLNWTEYVPFEGLLGLLYPNFFPFIHLKKLVIAWLSARTPYLSMVNKISGYMLAPEIRGILTSEQVAGAVSQMWRDPEGLRQLSEKLLELTRERGAARMIAEGIRENFISDQRIR